MDLNKLTASIQQHEGTGKIINGRFMPYADSRGFTSIGYGRCIQLVGISHVEATYLCSNDIQLASGEAQAQSWWPVVANDDVRSRALVEIIYNLGLPKFNQFVKAIAALSQSDFTTCADEFRNSAWYGEVGSSPGERGYDLAQMIQTGVDP